MLALIISIILPFLPLHHTTWEDGSSRIEISHNLSITLCDPRELCALPAKPLPHN